MKRPIDVSTPAATLNELAQAQQVLVTAADLLKTGLERLAEIGDALLAASERDEREGK